ncbi:MAG: hypothetical protein NXI03_10645, partial [Alphaproteobacteria bacterium]|nr:hypothetical protein [Alphaproteobacteria bacterium]
RIFNPLLYQLSYPGAGRTGGWAAVESAVYRRMDQACPFPFSAISALCGPIAPSGCFTNGKPLLP